jgi:hypothetical protein
MNGTLRRSVTALGVVSVLVAMAPSSVSGSLGDPVVGAVAFIVPEPASLLLLGAGLLVVSSRYVVRRTRR